jgi:spermidine synthase
MRIRTIETDGVILTLRERDGGAIDLLLGSVVLLSSAALETELAFGQLAPANARRVIVGGLGFGATARGVLSRVAKDAEVIVVEKVAAVATLMRGELAHLAGGVLGDPRVRVELGDVSHVIAEARDVDAILLDVDNGPEWASFRTNAKLYSPVGLASAHRALVPGGTFAVWSGYAKDVFVASLRKAGFEARTEMLREKGVVQARAYVGVKAA